LNTSFPFMAMLPYWLPWPRRSSVSKGLLTALLLGQLRLAMPAPLLCMACPRSPSSPASVACITTAPAPSPNRMHVPRSFQSTKRDRQSAPTTTTVLAMPDRR